MNSGSLLDSLLAAGKTSPASSKISKQQPSNQPVEGFQSTMAQVRPKVAARPPQATQKAESPHRTQASGHAAVAPSRREAQRPDAPANNRDMSASKSGSTSAAADVHDKNPKSADEVSVVDSHSQAKLGASDHSRPDETARGDNILSAGDEKPVEESFEPLAMEAFLNLDQALPADNAVLPSELIADAASKAIAGLGLLSPGLTSAPESASELGLEGVSDAGLDALLTAPATEGAILPPDFAHQLTGSVALNAEGAGTISSLNSLQGNALQGGVTNQILPELTGEEDLTLMPAAATGEQLVNEVGDNPDLLLLNAKAVMAKLAEASASSLDKSASTVELPKGLTAAAPAIETLSRLAEAQSPNTRGFVVQTGVPVPVGQPQWGQGVGERVLWLAAQNVSAAEIRLDPPELGPMQVRVSLNQEQVNVSFVSPHPIVRDALDQQLQRLREMFSEQGLNLGDVDVSDKSFAQQDQERDESARKANTSVDNEELAPIASSVVTSNRLVDHYA